MVAPRWTSRARSLRFSSRWLGATTSSFDEPTVLDALAAAPGERILEVGCGAGLCLREIAVAVGPAGRAVGIDISSDQIRAAETHCEGLANVEARVGRPARRRRSRRAFRRDGLGPGARVRGRRRRRSRRDRSGHEAGRPVREPGDELGIGLLVGRRRGAHRPHPVGLGCDTRRTRTCLSRFRRSSTRAGSTQSTRRRSRS